jgi:hypothetical protein
MTRSRFAAAVLLATVALSGCGQDKPAVEPQPAPAKPDAGPTDEVAAERAKLSPDDRALVEAQEWCVISSDERLGSMGPPIKLDVKGQAVFICCKGCKRKAEADPDKTLAKVAELKAKAKAEKPTTN